MRVSRGYTHSLTLIKWWSSHVALVAVFIFKSVLCNEPIFNSVLHVYRNAAGRRPGLHVDIYASVDCSNSRGLSFVVSTSAAFS